MRKFLSNEYLRLLQEEEVLAGELLHIFFEDIFRNSADPYKVSALIKELFIGLLRLPKYQNITAIEFNPDNVLTPDGQIVDKTKTTFTTAGDILTLHQVNELRRLHATAKTHLMLGAKQAERRMARLVLVGCMATTTLCCAACGIPTIYLVAEQLMKK